jgi:hypothetical protein
MAAFDSACTWLCATNQRRDGAALSLDLAFIRVTGSAIGFSQFSYRVLNGGRETNSAQSVRTEKAIKCQVPDKVQGNQDLCPETSRNPSPSGGIRSRALDRRVARRFVSRSDLPRYLKSDQGAQTISVADLQHFIWDDLFNPHCQGAPRERH